MRFDSIKNSISKDRLYSLVEIRKLSKTQCCEELNICMSTLSKLLDYYQITYTIDTKSKAKKTAVAKELKFQQILNSIDKEEFKDLYLNKNLSYIDLQKHYKVTGWTLDKIIREWGFKKSRTQSASLVLQTKYSKAGSKETYDKDIHQKSTVTKVARYGSEEKYLNHLSKKCHDSWMQKPIEWRLQHAQDILQKGGGWNQQTAQKTLQDRYGVNNAYALATYKSQSKINEEFSRLLTDADCEWSTEFRLGSKEHYYRYDFIVNKYLLEINPAITHNTTYSVIPNTSPKTKTYHKNKSQLARENGYQCIHVWDWDDQDKIINLLKPQDKVYARKCILKEVDIEDAKSFINQHHLQGYVRDQIRIGLYYESELISIMTFGKPRYNKKYQYELLRYCSSKKVIGGASKIFKYFIDNYSVESIISYCDWSKFSGQVYERLGFTFKSYSIGKHWYNMKTGVHITDNLLRQRGFDQLLGDQYGCFGKGTLNEQLMRDHGFVEIYDAGQAVYNWKRRNSVD